jgi:hypothetical protein
MVVVFFLGYTEFQIINEPPRSMGVPNKLEILNVVNFKLRSDIVISSDLMTAHHYTFVLTTMVWASCKINKNLYSSLQHRIGSSERFLTERKPPVCKHVANCVIPRRIHGGAWVVPRTCPMTQPGQPV